MRLFTCVIIPDDIKADLINFQERLKRIPIKAKFVEKRNLHITITFLGEKDPNELKTTIKKLTELSSLKPFNISLGGLKVIRTGGNIKVIGIHVKDTENELKTLIKSVANSVGGKYHLESKLTLCRVSNVLDKNKVLNFLNNNADVKFDMFEVNSINLMQSTLTSSGPIYKNIFTKRL